MKELMIQDLKAVTEATSAPMVSIYLSRDPRLNAKPLMSRWKQALLKVEHLLVKDYTRSFVHAFMEPLRQAAFFQSLETLDKGFIVFYSTEYQAYMRVQTSLNDLVIVADSFHIKPLLRIKNTERGYFVIGVSSRLITVSVESSGHLYRMEVIRNPTIFDNQDAPKSKSLINSFISHSAVQINKSLSQFKMPVILAGVKDYTDQMRKSLSISYILDEIILANIETMKSDEVRERCFEILEPYYQKKELEAAHDLNLAVKKNQAITYIEDIALSAVLGKIEKLFVVENKQLWGSVNKQTGEVFISQKQLSSHEDDILDDICQIVLAKGGEVTVLKDGAHVKGYIAAAIVTDTSHLYDFNQHYNSPGM